MADSGGFDKNSTANIFLVAISISLVCSIMVASSAVILKERQDVNVLLDQQRNILVAAGVLAEGETEDAEGRTVQEIFTTQFEERFVDLEAGRFIKDPARLTTLKNYNPIKSSRDANQSIELTSKEDIATLLRRERLSKVYIKKKPNGRVDALVLPVRGYGLWGTLYGYLALRNDYLTVSGLGFYAHKETPGLGGEVDNPTWKAQWPGKLLYDESGQPAIKLVKTKAVGPHKVDALAGATLTSRGVENLIKFWTGDLGFGPFLKNLKDGDA